MSPDSDVLVDRRRLKRRLALWRLVAFVALAALIVVAAWPLPGLPGASRIVTVGIDGLILADRERERAIRGLAEDQGNRTWKFCGKSVAPSAERKQNIGASTPYRRRYWLIWPEVGADIGSPVPKCDCPGTALSGSRHVRRGAVCGGPAGCQG